MLDNTIFKKYVLYTFYFSIIIGFIGLWFSPFLVSLATGLIALTTIPYSLRVWSKNKIILSGFIALIVLTLIDYLRTNDSAVVSAKLLLVIGFAFLQIAALYHLRNKEKESILLVLIFATIVMIINGIAVGNYWMNKDYFDEMLLQSKAIPVLKMHHIHFGVINGLMLLFLGGLYLKKMLSTNQNKLVITLFVGIFICFHILGSRTGLLSFYVASIIGLVAFSISTKRYTTLLLGIVIMGMAIGAAYTLSTSFKNKISNSIEDYESWSHGDDINYKSMAMRLEAYKACIGIIKEHPLVGVGSGNQEQELQQMYTKQRSVLLMENRVGPHNQILEFALKYGVLGIILVLGYFYYFLKGIQMESYIFISIMVMLFTALQFESLWERQGSIFFTSILVALGTQLFKGNKNIIQE